MARFVAEIVVVVGLLAGCTPAEVVAPAPSSPPSTWPTSFVGNVTLCQTPDEETLAKMRQLPGVTEVLNPHVVQLDAERRIVAFCMPIGCEVLLVPAGAPVGKSETFGWQVLRSGQISDTIVQEAADLAASCAMGG